MKFCPAHGLTHKGERWYCIHPADHPGAHMDDHGHPRHLPGQVLQDLTQRWGRTHKFAFTGKLWIATHRDPRTHWRTQIEPCPDLLEQRLRAQHGPPPGPIPPPRTATD
ncbi:hypothetical protein [Nocardiopsis alkaliphila]|uniref:hypothetical protein n=1 Tax=Nocardiopsis alkaliphila TaxID=225762 RepID=UPI00034B2E69|nr:hypothetical protein [Nocardiopsis alkaliphila]